MRKDRAASNSGRGKAGREAARPDPLDPFDPFESFDAHDLAAGRRSSTADATGSDAANAGSSTAGSSTSSTGQSNESTYTRSRREPSASSDESSGRSKKPARSLKARALDYLSRREYSRSELSRKLAPFVEEADALEPLLDALESEGWLSDSRFAESLVHRRAARMGTSRIVGELRRHSVGDALIEEVGAQLRETELARAQAVWRKKYGHLPETPAERAKQARFLATRGFSSATIVKILKGGDEDWDGV
ncbi:recombination regulator RecX [Trinickia violacea]|uniref:Regulatory protein RecX n=1 Tax=Trinickia violacea TaxID=2571746 RepID=A0A4P8IN79_9BURK|nr:recombination regulator RecX [Trinickia violacea]